MDFKVLVALLILVLFPVIPHAATAQEYPIEFEVGTYGGRYCFNDLGNCHSNTGTHNLTEGRHLILIAPGNQFFINVDNSGNVTSENSDAASGTGNKLEFNVSSVEFVPNGYSGRFEILGASDELSLDAGPVSVELIHGLKGHTFLISPGTAFVFSTNADGAPVVKPAHGTVSGQSVTLNTTTAYVVPREYSGEYRILGAMAEKASGIQRVGLIRGIQSYYFQIAPGNGFLFDVNNHGSLRVPSGRQAFGNGAVLELIPQRVTFLPFDPTLKWFVRGVEPLVNPSDVGARDLWLLPGTVGYILQTAQMVNARFDLKPSGEPRPEFVRISADPPQVFTLARTEEDVFVCKFFADAVLRETIGEYEPGTRLMLEADLLIEKREREKGPSGVTHWATGLVRLTGPGEDDLVEGNGEEVRIAVADSQDTMSIRFHKLNGSLGGVKASGAGWYLQLYGGPDTLSGPEMPLTGAQWDAFDTERLLTIRGLPRNATADLDAPVLDGGQCETH